MEEKQATKAEIKERRKKCWHSGCKAYAFLRDYTGYKYCIKHWYHSMRWGGGNKWFYVKTTKIEFQ